MDKDTIKKLSASLPVYNRPGGGGAYTYIKGKDVIKRLNYAFKGEWSSIVKDTQVTDHYVVVCVSLIANNIEHQGFGGAEIKKFSSGERKGQPVNIQDSYKSAFTNALKKAAEQFGVGLGLEEPIEDIEETVENKENKKSYTPTRTNKSQKPVSSYKSKQIMPSNPTSISGNAVVSNKTEKPDKEINIVQLDTMLRELISEHSNASNLAEMVNSEKLNKKEKDTLNNYIKTTKTKNKKNTEQAVPFNTSNIVDTANTITNLDRRVDDTNKINDIQLGALRGLSKSRGFNEESAILQALPGCKKNSFSELNKKEARAIIKTLNNIR